MKNIKYIIIILILLLIFISVLLVIVNNKNKNNGENILKIDTEGDVGQERITTNNVEKVENLGDLKNIENCIQSYYDIFNNNSDMYYTVDDSGNKEKLFNDEDINKIRLDLISKSYIEKNNITVNNLNKYIKSINEKVIVIVSDIRTAREDSIDKYIVEGILINYDNTVVDKFYMYVNLDIENNTYSIEPIYDKVQNIDNIKINDNIGKIEKNKNNTYKNVVMNYDEISNYYINRYKRLAIAYPELAYNYLDEQYREARFGSLDNFKKYVQKNKEDIAKIRAASYITNYKDGYTEYVVKDQYDNIYVFEEKAVLDYTVKLDTYTLESDKFNSTYKTATNKEKVLMNLDKFFQMLNANDYSSAYGVLSDEFKAKYFKTEDSFEAFVKQYMYVHANTTYMNYSDEISGVYTYYIELTDKANEKNPKKKMNIVMKLLEGTDFKISFEVIN